MGTFHRAFSRLVTKPSQITLLWRAPFVEGQRSVYAERLEKEELEQASSFYDSTIERYASEPPRILTLQQLVTIGREALRDKHKALQYTEYVQRELPKRLARRLLDLRFLPYIVVTNPHIKQVYNAYYHAFHTLIKWDEVKTIEQNRKYAELLQRLVDQHTPMLDALATGVKECRTRRFVGKHLQLDDFLDSMLRSRISRRVIAEHLIRLEEKRPDFIGCIRTNINMHESVTYAAQQTNLLCSEVYGETVAVHVTGDLHMSMPYVPAHVDYMLRELLKNAVRAVVEHHRNVSTHRPRMSSCLPPIEVKICEAQDEVTLRISDEGGGIPHDQLESVWQYGYTTIDKADNAPDASLLGSFSASASSSDRSRLAGLGFGLPFSRLNARYFGGDLQLVSMPGYGTDAFLTLKRLRDQEWAESVEGDLATEANGMEATP